MTIAAPFLYWIGGALGMAAVVGFGRHKGLGVLLAIASGMLTFWAVTGTTLTIPSPVVHPSPSPHASSTR